MMTEIDEKFIEEKAKELVCDLLDLQPGAISIYENEWVEKTKDFIRSLFKEIPVKKATVSEELINKWTRILHIPYSTGHGIKETKKDIKNMFTEAGLEVKK